VRPGGGCHVYSASSTAGGSQGAADLLGSPATDYRPRRCAAEFAGTPSAIAIRATQRCGKTRTIRTRFSSPRRSVGHVERPRLSGRVDAHDRVTGGHTAGYRLRPVLALKGPRAVQVRLLLPGARRVVDQEIRSRIDWARQDVRARRDLDEVLTRVEKMGPRSQVLLLYRCGGCAHSATPFGRT
jgi:hypothetical protein